MFSADVRSLLVQVFSSWQVLTVTLVIILYFFLVTYVAKVYHNRPRKTPLPKKKSKAKEKEAGEEKPEDPLLDESDELGLEEQRPRRGR